MFSPIDLNKARFIDVQAQFIDVQARNMFSPIDLNKAQFIDVEVFAKCNITNSLHSSLDRKTCSINIQDTLEGKV